MKKLKLKFARLFHAESAARCKARLKRNMKELYKGGIMYNILSDGEFGYYRYY